MTDLNIHDNEIFNNIHINKLTTYRSRIYNYLFNNKNEKIKYNEYKPDLSNFYDIIFTADEDVDPCYDDEIDQIKFYYKYDKEYVDDDDYETDINKVNELIVKKIFGNFKFIKIINSKYEINSNIIFCIYNNSFGYIINEPQFEYYSGYEIIANKEKLKNNTFYNGNKYTYNELIKRINRLPDIYYNQDYYVNQVVMDPMRYFNFLI